MTWEEAKTNSDKLNNSIEALLNKQPPKNINDILLAVAKVDKDTLAIPNPNSEGLYGQLILYPSPKWKTFVSTSMSISRYGIYN